MPNPYQSPAANPPRSTSRPRVWLNVLRAIAYNATILVLVLLGCHFMANGQIWRMFTCLIFAVVVGVSKLRPKEANHKPRPAELVLYILGLLAVLAITLRWLPRFQLEFYFAVFFCWTYLFNVVRDSLYVVSVEKRTRDEQPPPG